MNAIRPISDVRGASRSGSHQFSPSPSLDSSDEDEQLHEHEDRPHLDKPAHSVYHELANRSIFSIAGVMDRERGVDESPTSTMERTDDPIGLGILSMDECDSLFHHYFDQLQTCVCLLDPAIHTATYTRHASPELFTAVLTVASKFFRPELYERVLESSDRLVSNAIAQCVATIELVQAICILHYWKKPTDGRGWLRLGHAIRLGYQLDLHLPPRRPLPAGERKARLAIDRERTWISLFCFDSTATQLSDRPSMMHRAPDVAEWIRTIPYPLPSDGQLDFAVKTSLLQSEVRQLQSCRSSYDVLRSGLRRVLEDLHRSHDFLRSDKYAVTLTSTSVSINDFSTLAVQLLVECTSLALAPRKHRNGLLHSCVGTSLKLLDIVIDGFGRQGIMPMIEDAHSVAVASTVVRLIGFMAYLDPPAKASVLRKLSKVVIVCREAARGDHSSHPAYLARFINALLDNARQGGAPPRAHETGNPHLYSLASTTPSNTAPSLSSTLCSHVAGPHNPAPDQWWEEAGQIAYQEALQPEQANFWDGFPLLANAMNSLGTQQPPPQNGVQMAVDQLGLDLDTQWDPHLLGLQHAPAM
ncbi:hypothetical protein CspeluHIS016_0207380 [Cutaneotrichosporon spelunceum]|uniref:Xylanolytic transcriptional activator regulatory domain-containing protein n=1 Tax=Cutaneotrichosporon spelunceum TaxID=1672016 RepID=A0AAD3TRU0_9TREE|nr:hypothetical protein CspeluHIS016_0207380 [Cutaneotrichosporon spelunceum]